MALTVLRDSLVLVEFGLPRGCIERGNNAGHGLPFDDREAGFGEPGRSTDAHSYENQGRNREQPQPDGAAADLEG